MTSLRTFFLVLAGAAVVLLLQQPLCEAAHPIPHRTTESASCCVYAGSVNADEVLDAALDSAGKPAPAPLAVIYLGIAALFAVRATRFTSALGPPRSFYARSARILR